MKKRNVSLLSILMIGLSLSISVARANAGTRFEQMEKFREILRQENIDGDRDRALKAAKELLSEVSPRDPLYIDLQNFTDRLDTAGANDRLQEAIKFVTGNKDEIYCRGVGLVEVTGDHNNGAKSRLILVRNNRAMKNTFSKMYSGDWVYELGNTYRKPMTSDLFVVGTDNSYKVSEVRERPSGGLDKGVYLASWDEKGTSNSYSSNGEVEEPAPMYMATDYHLWGNRDLGYKIDFKVGSKSQSSGREDGGSKEILMDSTRIVTDHMPSHRYTDSKGKAYEYNDCFRVHYTIVLKELRDLPKRK